MGSNRVAAIVHDFEAPLECDVLVALTARAFQTAIDLGLAAAKVPDDFFDWTDVLADKNEYLKWQLDWLRRLEAASELGAVLTAAHFFKAPMDVLVVTTRVLRRVVESLEPESVMYAGPPISEDKFRAIDLQFRPRLGDTPLAARVLPILAGAVGFHYETKTLTEVTPEVPPSRRALAGLRRKAHIALNIMRAERRSDAAALLLWYEGYGVRRVVSDMKDSGVRPLFLLRGDATTRILRPAMSSLRPVSNEVECKPTDSPIPSSTEARRMLREIDYWAGVAGVSVLLERRLDWYLGSVCPIVEAGAKQLVDALRREKIGYIAATNPSSTEEFIALLAGKMAGVHRILHQHGDQAFPFDFWLITETQNFEEMCCSDPTVPEYLEQASRSLGTSVPEMRLASARVEEMVRRAQSRGWQTRHASDLPFFYIPHFLTGDQHLIGTPYFEDAWYYRWQLKLLDLMIAHPEIEFVWKSLPSANEAYDPIPDVIRRKGPSNVRYEWKPLRNVVSEAGRILMDYPTTALYEAVHYRKPVLCVFFERLGAVRPGVQEIFGGSLKSCADEESALHRVAEFLASEASRYVVPPFVLGSKSEAGGPALP